MPRLFSEVPGALPFASCFFIGFISDLVCGSLTVLRVQCPLAQSKLIVRCNILQVQLQRAFCIIGARFAIKGTRF